MVSVNHYCIIQNNLNPVAIIMDSNVTLDCNRLLNIGSLKHLVKLESCLSNAELEVASEAGEDRIDWIGI